MSDRGPDEESYGHCLLSNIPSNFHASDLRNFFSVFTQSEKFSLFHFRHRPQLLNVVSNPSTNYEEQIAEGQAEVPEGGGQNNLWGEGTATSSSRTTTTSKTTSTTVIKKFCCPIRFQDDKTLAEFMRKYHGKCWIDKAGNELPSRAIISIIDLNEEDLSNFASKEFRPPKFMPRGNIGTPNEYFLNQIKECKLPPSLIKKLGLEFPRGRVYKKYSNVPYDYKTSVKRKSSKYDDEEEEVTTGKGHTLSSVYLPKHKEKDNRSDEDKNDSDKESNVDDDDDRCEEWERHEALNDHTTSHGTFMDEDKERLYEDKIELQWEKGGPGVVFYTDTNFWNDQKGGFDEETADDLDVDMEGYYVPGAGDKDAQDFMEMRRSERFKQGLEDVTVFAPKSIRKLPRRSSPPGPSSSGFSSKKEKIGSFEKHTRGIGRKILEQHGWTDGQGLGTTIIGMADALEGDGQGPMDRRGFGFYGEKIEYTSRNPRHRRKQFKDYRVDAPDRIVIGTIYDKPEDLDIQEPVLRSNAPTFIKRYKFVKGAVQKR